MSYVLGFLAGVTLTAIVATLYAMWLQGENHRVRTALALAECDVRRLERDLHCARREGAFFRQEAIRSEEAYQQLRECAVRLALQEVEREEPVH
jgi:hypothetical protein